MGRERAPWLDARVAPLVTGNPSALPLALELLKGRPGRAAPELWTGRVPAKNDPSVIDRWVLERLKEPAAAAVRSWDPAGPHQAASTLLKLA